MCLYWQGPYFREKNSLKEARADYDKAIALALERDPDPVSGRQAQNVARTRSAKLAEDARLRSRTARASGERAGGPSEREISSGQIRTAVASKAGRGRGNPKGGRSRASEKSCRKVAASERPPNPPWIKESGSH